MRPYLQSTLFASAILVAPLRAEVIHVDAAASGTRDGTTWTNAFNDLQSAISSAVSGDEIWVARGIYLPSDLAIAGDPRSATFRLVSGVSIYGGFSGDGNETLVTERDPAAHVTILSGDLLQDDTSGGDNSENAYHVVTGSGANAAALDGFTITKGNANGSYPHHTGGGLFCFVTSTSIAVSNCAFINNWGELAGGAYSCNAAGNSSFSKCVFQGNSTDRDGGAIFNNVNVLTLDECSFVSNTANDDGGAIAAEYGPVFATGCTFTGNQSKGTGGAIDFSGLGTNGAFTDCVFSNNSASLSAGGLSIYNSNAPVTRCTFSGNRAFYGGALMITANALSVVDRCTFANNSANQLAGAVLIGQATTTLSNCLFTVNTCRNMGGALVCDYSAGGGVIPVNNCVFSGNSARNGGACYNSNGSLTEYIHCTFSGNSATDDGGAIHNNAASSTLMNSVIWNNRAALATGTVSASVHLSGAAATFGHCLVANSGGSAAWNTALGTDAGNNIDADPQFVAPSDFDTGGDFRLLAGSPGIDAAIYSASTESHDLAGNPRIFGFIDLGAYEGGYVTFAHLFPALDRNDDANQNGRSNFADYAAGVDPSAPHDPDVQPSLVISGGSLTLKVTVLSNAADVIASYRMSTDLQSFQPMTGGVDYQILTREDLGSGREGLTLELLVDLGSSPRRFFQQVFTASP